MGSAESEALVHSPIRNAGAGAAVASSSAASSPPSSPPPSPLPPDPPPMFVVYTGNQPKLGSYSSHGEMRMFVMGSRNKLIY